MTDIRLDANDDLLLNGDSSDLDTISDDEELAQTCQTILSIELGEYLLDLDLGMSRENLLSKYPNVAFIQQDIEDCLTEQEPRVAAVAITNFDWDKVNRLAKIELEIEKQDRTKITTTLEVSEDAE